MNTSLRNYILLFVLIAVPGVYIYLSPAVEPVSDEGPHKPDVQFLVTPHNVVDVMLSLAQLNENDLIYDLGCGDARILIAAAKKYGCRGVGYDIDPERVKESRENVKTNGLEHLVRIEEADIFTLDLSEADVIMMYLLPELNNRLVPQLQTLKPGSRIVSHYFDMNAVEGGKEFIIPHVRDESDPYDLYGPDDELEESPVYLWTTPLKVKEE
ncbi:MAG: class I SAM-dependent methyltransferase [Candidatus Hinthialibacter antarcticus]|nr:class I SAM-dependent methyltransferase [Candidatus Hinthialibacter antarcticus]